MVSGRDAAVHEGLLVNAAESFQQLPGDVERFLPGQRTEFQALRQRERIRQLGGHRHAPFNRNGGVERDDVRVREAGANAHLTQEPLGGIGIVERRQPSASANSPRAGRGCSGRGIAPRCATA